jgi:hypothetical protein
MLGGSDNAGFLMRIIWLEREIITGAHHAGIVVDAIRKVLKRTQLRVAATWQGGGRRRLWILFPHCLQCEVVSYPENPKDYSFDFHLICFPSLMVLALKTPTRLSGYRSANLSAN